MHKCCSSVLLWYSGYVPPWEETWALTRHRQLAGWFTLALPLIRSTAATVPGSVESGFFGRLCESVLVPAQLLCRSLTETVGFDFPSRGHG